MNINFHVDKENNRLWCFRGTAMEDGVVVPLDMAEELACQHDNDLQEIAVAMVIMQEEEKCNAS